MLYENEAGHSELYEQLNYLEERSRSIKDARIQLSQIKFCVDLLSLKGTIVPSTIVKHITKGIWELRPGKNRILFFFDSKRETYVLLHMFAKKTQKTPKHEIERALKEMNDYVVRNGG